MGSSSATTASGGVLAHEVVHRPGFTVEGDLVLAHGVEAEERFLVVEDVELEQRGEVVDADLHGGLLHQA
jgi:hypothetical protein